MVGEIFPQISYESITIHENFTLEVFTKGINQNGVVYYFKHMKEDNGSAVLPSSNRSLAKTPQIVEIHCLLYMLKLLTKPYYCRKLTLLIVQSSP